MGSVSGVDKNEIIVSDRYKDVNVRTELNGTTSLFVSPGIAKVGDFSNFFSFSSRYVVGENLFTAPPDKTIYIMNVSGFNTGASFQSVSIEVSDTSQKVLVGMPTKGNISLTSVYPLIIVLPGKTLSMKAYIAASPDIYINFIGFYDTAQIS
jgi:hypothetical protein